MNKNEIDKKKILTAFEPKKICSICDSPYNEEAGGIQGHFGIMPVTFCEWCYSSIYDMIYQDVEIEIIDQFKENNQPDKDYMRTVLSKVGIDYKIVEQAYEDKQRFFNVTFNEPCGMSHK